LKVKIAARPPCFLKASMIIFKKTTLYAYIGQVFRPLHNERPDPVALNP
jgi:hypothetical protein